MSITSSLYTGVTGLLTYSSALSVIGNNLANVNTVGYKAARAQFADLLSGLEGGARVGHGVRLASVAPQFAQGVFQATGGTTDLSIQGDGFFIVNNSQGNQLYSRDGQFSLDKNGSLTNPAGLMVQGFPLDDQGDLIGGLNNIVIGQGASLLPAPTSKMNVAVNLDARTPVPAAAPTWPAGPSDTTTSWHAAADFGTTVTAFDSLGQAHDVTLLFVRTTTAEEWDYRVLVPDLDVNAGGTAGNLTEITGAGGTLHFNPDGSLDVANSTIPTITITGLVNGAADITLLTGNDLAFTASTQFADESVLNNFSQNGSTAGILSGIAIDTQGVITGQYSNGSVLSLYQIALADFPGVDKLSSVGDNLFEQSSGSGDAVIGPAGRGGFGVILPGGLELSTVDVATEFVTMITTQRGFQANSRIITVADQMYEEAVNLKR